MQCSTSTQAPAVDRDCGSVFASVVYDGIRYSQRDLHDVYPVLKR